MKDENQYYRIDNTYYQSINVPLISGDVIERITPRREKFILRDNDKDILDRIPIYHGFCCIPSHTNYQQKVHEFYNTYSKLLYEPKPGSIKNSLEFMHHIFGEQIEFGLDYFKLLYEFPTQNLPILCLVSKERNTGKSTFIHWLKVIFGKNITYNKTEDFRSQFNSDWAGKLAIVVDETIFDRREDQEKIKNVSTAKSYKVEAKGQDRREVENFSKIVLVSNYEVRFTRIEFGETRYWVRKIPLLAFDDVDFDKKLVKEIPAFLDYLLKRTLKSANVSRMWFNPSDLKTEALLRVMRFSRDALEIELVNIIQDIIEVHELNEFQFCPTDLKPLLARTPYANIVQTRLKHIYKTLWKLKPVQNNLSYTKIRVLSDGTLITEKTKGRYFSVSMEFLKEYYGELLE